MAFRALAVPVTSRRRSCANLSCAGHRSRVQNTPNSASYTPFAITLGGRLLCMQEIPVERPGSVSPVRARELPQLARVLRHMRATACRKPATSLLRSGLIATQPSGRGGVLSIVIPPSRTADLDVPHRMSSGFADSHIGRRDRSSHRMANSLRMLAIMAD